jgi:hypothetical protein
MKSSLTLLLLLPIFSVKNCLSQGSEKYDKYDRKLNYFTGYIIRTDSTKEEGLIKDNGSINYTTVMFVSKSGLKTEFQPGSLRGFGVIGRDFISDGEYFYEKEGTGWKLTLYNRHDKNVSVYPGIGGPLPIVSANESKDYYLKRKSEEKFFKVRRGKFIPDLSEYFKDCPYLRSKIMTKELVYKDIKKIVYEYNSSCK